MVNAMRRYNLRASWLPLALLLFTLGGPQLLAQDDAGLIAASEALPKVIDQFGKQFKKELKKSILRDDKELRNRLTKRTADLANEVKRFSKRAQKGKDPKAREDLDRAMTMAFDINKQMAEHRFSETLENGWRDVRDQLNELAGYYSLEPLAATS